MESFHPNISHDDNFPRSKSCNKGKSKQITELNHRARVTKNSLYTVEKQEKIKERKFTLSDKEKMLEQIKIQEIEITFMQIVVNHFLDINELMKVKQDSTYDPEMNTWILPSFVVKQRKTCFPNLHREIVKNLVNPEFKRTKFVVKNEMDVGGYETLYNGENRPTTSFPSRRSVSKNCREKIKFEY